MFIFDKAWTMLLVLPIAAASHLQESLQMTETFNVRIADARICGSEKHRKAAPSTPSAPSGDLALIG